MNTRTDKPAPPADRPEDLYPVVRRLAAVFARRRPVTAEDMEQVGMAELLTRWHQFDPALSARKTWAAAVARRGMLNAMRRGETDAVIYLPRTARARGHAYPKYVRLRRSDRYSDRDGPAGGPYRLPVLADHRPAAPAPPDPRDCMAAATALAGRPLTRLERGVVLLYFVRGMTMIEAGRHMGYSESGVSGIASRLVAACRENAGVMS